MNIFDEKIVLGFGPVILRPISIEDIPLLQNIVYDEDTWKLNVNKISDDTDLNDFVSKSVEYLEKKIKYTFLVFDKRKRCAAGCTSFLNISEKDKRLEIGGTWLSKDYRGKGINKLCKFLLLRFVFEELNYERVEFKTDVLNIRSRKAMLKIGAVEEGTLRSHTLMHNGRRRDTIYYSILRNEWAEIKPKIFSEYL